MTIDWDVWWCGVLEKTCPYRWNWVLEASSHPPHKLFVHSTPKIWTTFLLNCIFPFFTFPLHILWLSSNPLPCSAAFPYPIVILRFFASTYELHFLLRLWKYPSVYIVTCPYSYNATIYLSLPTISSILWSLLLVGLSWHFTIFLLFSLALLLFRTQSHPCSSIWLGNHASPL